jgi:hypothetical protein
VTERKRGQLVQHCKREKENVEQQNTDVRNGESRQHKIIKYNREKTT